MSRGKNKEEKTGLWDEYKTGFRTVWKNILINKREVILLSSLGVVVAALDLLGPLIFSRAIDLVVENNTITNTVIVLAIIYVATFIFGRLSDHIFQTRHLQLAVNLRSSYKTQLFSKLLRLKSDYLVSQKMGALVSKINKGANTLEIGIVRVALRLFPLFLTAIGAIIVSYTFHPSIGLVFTVFAVVLGWGMFKMASRVGPLYKEFHKHDNRVSGAVSDIVYNVELVKNLATETRESKEFKKLYYGDRYHARMKVLGMDIQNYTIRRSIIDGFSVIMIFVGVFGLQKGFITVGEIFAILTYFRKILFPIRDLVRRWEQLQDGLVSLNFSEEIKNQPTEIYHPKNAYKPKPLRGDIEFKDVSFSYIEHDEKENKDIEHTLKNLTFSAKAGEVVALVGRSGAGKSTLIKLLMGYYFPQKGSLTIDGHQIEKVDLELLRKQIGIVPQDISLFNNTISHNISYGTTRVSQKKIKEATKKAFAYDFIEDFPEKWQQQVGEKGLKLSGGQKQRIAIARAILRDPKVLILDEPTSALDAESEHAITQALDVLMKGRTTFIIAHRLSTVRRADKIIVMEKGEIIETGTHKELLKKKNGHYRKLYDLQIGLR